MTAGLLEVEETLEHLDFEAEVACEIQGPTCTNTAEWLLRCRVCGDQSSCCAPCKAAWIAHSEQHPRALRFCPTCGMPVLAAVWQRYVEFRPIGGAS